MDLARIARHLAVFPGAARRAFPPGSLDAIEKAIREAERTHAGQIRFAVERALDLAVLLRGQSAPAFTVIFGISAVLRRSNSTFEVSGSIATMRACGNRAAAHK